MIKLTKIVFILFVYTFPNLIAQEKTRIAEDIEIIKLSNEVYLHVSYFQTTNFGKVGANGLILIKNGKGLLIDTPWNDQQTNALYRWVNDSLNTSIDTFIATHWHEDCIGGLAFLESKGIKSYANQMTIDIAKEKNLPIPQKGFADSLRIEFQGIPVDCFYFGGGHSTDNILVSLPNENILFGGCCIKDMNATNLGNLEDADIISWPLTMEKIMGRFSNTSLIVPGHGKIGNTELIRHTIDLLNEYNK